MRVEIGHRCEHGILKAEPCKFCGWEVESGVRDGNTGKLTAMAKRGYSRDFTPKSDRRVRIEVDRIPPTLYDAVSAKAKREGVSLRALVLRLLKEWVERG